MRQRDAPDNVSGMQVVLQAQSRVLVLRHLLRGPTTFDELLRELDMSVAGCRQAIYVLTEAGYVTDDADPSYRRKPSETRYWALRERVAGDALDFVKYLLS
ncbi:winged helix-turn-helix transcriptional regulator [Clavibacter michiganensis]|uniref:ArsR family transcriptional regulator n=1 Tax=Clavibacter michiganensis subsp. insidiosus TaxID=33014 RepID=A0A0D5CMZ1_9MICO|nr:winged helix-turn-helix transcriptional regulator [Clavibacter michiganensis]AJW80635.1 ArsR family transcriptional regulator [Clavibacter michiganensis subsp. insidiosus]AWF99817.1 transcriptional regulator [Clavibacter michiganensis subsp. insidiosus]AWG02921.1 transcriptional regulator [Clavibacter michiganensis subsp. insidiosus]OQJ56856.1 transcriptional regulator [Clavibacter michiganensis subsp. insidiosus]RII88823.1 ArsR family transcriptional regulator [Clavibacter michiganensis su